MTAVEAAPSGRGHVERRRLELEPRPDVCPACLTDNSRFSCPDECPDPRDREVMHP